MKNFDYENSMQNARVILNNLLNKYLGQNLSMLEKKNENELSELEYLKKEMNNYIKKYDINLTNNKAEKVNEIINNKTNSRNTIKKLNRDLSGGDRIIQKKNKRQKTINNLKNVNLKSPFQNLNKSADNKKKIPIKKSKTINNIKNEIKKSKSTINLIHVKNKKKIVKNSSKVNIKKQKITYSPNKKESNQSNSSIITKSTEKNSEEGKILDRKRKIKTPDKNDNKTHCKNESISNIFLKDISYEQLLINDNYLINTDLRLSSMELGIINNYEDDNENDEYKENTIVNTNNEINVNNLLTLEEKLETNYENIFKYLNNKEIFKLTFVNKNCFNFSIGYFISNLIREKEKINEELNELNNKQYN